MAPLRQRKPYQGDPRALELKPHQEIAIVIGTPPKKIPSKYKFPPGALAGAAAILRRAGVAKLVIRA